jgi:hypothetical protein
MAQIFASTKKNKGFCFSSIYKTKVGELDVAPQDPYDSTTHASAHDEFALKCGYIRQIVLYQHERWGTMDVFLLNNATR